jgi:autotransporter adhesin
MLIRISLVLAIVAALAAAGINSLQIHRRITAAIAERNLFRTERDQAASAKLQAQKLAGAVQVKLDQAARDLALTKDEREQAVATLEDQTKRAVTLAANLKKAQAEQDGFNQQLAVWKSLGIPVEQVKPTLASLKPMTEERNQLAAEKSILRAETLRSERLLAEIVRLSGKGAFDLDCHGEMPEGLKGTVLVSDPKYDFVLLDIGEKQGALEDGQMLVNRNGKLVAKVVITRVESERSIAYVMPGWKLDTLREGDQVFY